MPLAETVPPTAISPHAHRGANPPVMKSFTLIKLAEGWKIVDLAYRVEPEPPSRHPAGAP